MKRTHQNTYQRDPAAIERARAELRATLRDPEPDLAWQEDLPELPESPDEDATQAEVFQ